MKTHHSCRINNISSKVNFAKANRFMLSAFNGRIVSMKTKEQFKQVRTQGEGNTGSSKRLLRHKVIFKKMYISIIQLNKDNNNVRLGEGSINESLG
jgi:hypothetical protein